MKQIEPIAIIHTDFSEKFGIPRQPRLVKDLTAIIEFLPAFQQPETVRGLDGYSHIWLLWGFSENEGAGYNATVRPPRLGGKTRMGVFATRSPFRPNGIGMSAVKLERIEDNGNGGVRLIVSGADMLDGTPIYDIKPYVPISDCIPEATEGFTAVTKEHRLQVVFPKELLLQVPENKRAALCGVLEQDPRQTYFQAPDREYGLAFAGMNIKFTVDVDTLTVRAVEQ